jgi:hypothetical protein
MALCANALIEYGGGMAVVDRNQVLAGSSSGLPESSRLNRGER